MQRYLPVDLAGLAVQGIAYSFTEAPGRPVAVENPEDRVLISPRPEDPFGLPRERSAIPSAPGCISRQEWSDHAHHSNHCHSGLL